jgi:hypothetical protein
MLINSMEVISFAERIMTLLEQGRFTSTYKYAALLSLMDLSMEKFTNTGVAPESVTTRQLAEKVIQLYWLQTNPYMTANNEPFILFQNAGKKGAQASIINHITEFREHSKSGGFAPYFSAKHADKNAFSKLVDKVEWALIEMPLPRLQRMGTSERNFIYSITWDESIKKGVVNSYQKGTSKTFDNLIRFQPNVSSYFIQLSGLLRPLIQREWAMRVAETNKLEEAKLQAFLFRASRSSTAKLNTPLTELQNGKCFYCGKGLGLKGKNAPEVDHFIPWARYPNDSLSNFVVAHNHCNGAKRDFLAYENHLNSWINRITNSRTQNDFILMAELYQWEVGLDISRSVGSAIYLNLLDEVELWKVGKEFSPVSQSEVERIFAVC